MSIYDRRFGGVPGPSGGGSNNLQSGGGGGFMDQMRLQPPQLGAGMGVGMGGLSSSGSVSTPGAIGSGTTPTGGVGAIGSGSGGGGGGNRLDAVGPPLLLNNLAQHLNNPPPPSSHHSHPHAHSHSQHLQQQQQQQQQHGGHAHTHSQSQSSLTPTLSLGGLSGLGGAGGAGAGGGSMLHFGNSTSPLPTTPLAPGQAPPQSGKLLLLPSGAPPPAGSEEEKINELITELLDPSTREAALLELSKKREMYEDLALVLWGGFGVMSSLLLEIVNVYPALSPPSLTAHASNRVCNALALLQCVASHSETRSLFLNAHVPLFLYPFLNTTSKTRPFEYLRLTSLGVIGALVKQNDNSDVINFLLSTEIIPLCLRIMETGSELSKTVAIFIVQKILLDDLGLQYICQTYERFYAVGAVLGNMVATLVETQAVRLLKHVVRCYLRMSDNARAREALRACLPEALRDGSFNVALKGDMVTKRCLATLLSNLSERND